MKLKEPRDVLNRNAALVMKPEELTKMIKNTVAKLNRRLTSLEKSGLAKHSYSYGRVMNILKSDFGATRFSSKSVQNASHEERAKFLAVLQHYEQYGLTQRDLKKQLTEELANLNKAVKANISPNLKLSMDELLTIKDAMKKWREKIETTNIGDLFNSKEARMFFTEKRVMTQSQLKKFITELRKFNPNKEGESVYNPQDIDLFMTYYNTKYGKPVMKIHDFFYNPVSGQVLNATTKKETTATYDPATNIYTCEQGNRYSYDRRSKKTKI